MTSFVLYGAAAVLFVVTFVIARRVAGAKREQESARARAEAQAVRTTALAEAARERAQVEAEARTEALALREAAQLEATRAEEELRRREDSLRVREAQLAADVERVSAKETAAAAREQAVSAIAERSKKAEDERRRIEDELVKTLERVAGETRLDVRSRLVSEWVDDARAEAEESLRRLEEGATDAARGREAKRVMGIAIQRYAGHYLTERLLSNLPLVPGSVPKIFGASLEHIPVIEEVANIKLQLADDQSAVRLDGQDSFGREIARRAIARFGKNGARGDVKKSVEQIRDELEREVFDLGKRAFKELEIQRAHPDIVRLVGRLNWRTSYTQNQWKHAVEAAFLCGMMANELGLDVKLARRAALMHDIGKALTHAIDGSHAVIGADYARRLGESELVANAIGAHHADEPCNSAYASLVAAADAMSGARPGARREQTDNYVQRLEELERIGGAFPGVERAFAVQGGREVRIYVREDRVSDEQAVELSSEVAARISDELTFPGQIKVTVIREVRAMAVAG